MHNAVVTHILRHDNFLLIAHANPDGDTLGSSLALYIALRKLGKRVQVISENDPPVPLRMLPFADRLKKDAEMEGEYTAISVDCADEERMGKCAVLFRKAEHTINIDHHGTNNAYAQINDVDASAAAVGESIWEILCSLAVQPDSAIAQCLYAAISTDTGNFCYSNTTPRSFRIAAELLEIGFPLTQSCQMLFRTRTLSKTKLIGICIDNLELLFGNRVGISTLSQHEIETAGADDTETEGMIDFIRDIDTIDVAVFIREVSQGNQKISLRAKIDIDVSALAQRFGGGGHKRAAGCNIEGTAKEAKLTITTALSEFFA